MIYHGGCVSVESCFLFSLSPFFFLVVMALMFVEIILTCSPHELCTILFSSFLFLAVFFSCLSSYSMHVASSHARVTDFVPFVRLNDQKLGDE